MGSEHPGVVLLERDGALSTLEAAFGAVVAGRGGVALVSGEAGIGKTSVVRAFVAAEGRATRVLAGACDDLAVPRPLGPFLDIAGELPGLAVELETGEVDAARIVLDELGRDSTRTASPSPAARAAVRSSMAGDLSIATTVAPGNDWASAAVPTPGPQPRSTMRRT